MTHRSLVAASLWFAALGGCAFDVIHLKQKPALLVADETKAPLVLAEDVELTLQYGYRRMLRKGSRWDAVGRIGEGDVYRTRDQVLTVEASNISEAYIVVTAGELVGFYLPVERAFTPASEKKRLPIAPSG